MNKGGRSVIAALFGIAVPFISAVSLAAAPAGADDTAAASRLERLVAPLNGVSSLTVAEPAMVDMRNAFDCKLDSKLLRQKLSAALQAEKLPLTPDNAAPRPDLMRLTLKPEVATLKDGVVNCVSWVSLAAQTQETLKLPPSPDRKPVSITYWTRGALIMTPVVDHATGVADVYEKLARVLARQWRIDNPASSTDMPAASVPPANQAANPAAIPAGNPATDGLGSIRH